MSSYLDHLPSQEREKIRKRLRSPEEYERLREKVKGPEDLEREMEKNAEFAEARLSLETDPSAQEKGKEEISKQLAEQGIESVLESPNEEAKKALQEGRFRIVMTEKSKEPRLAVSLQQPQGTEAPSGNVSEVLALTPALQQQLLTSFTLNSSF